MFVIISIYHRKMLPRLPKSEHKRHEMVRIRSNDAARYDTRTESRMITMSSSQRETVGKSRIDISGQGYKG